MGVAREARLVGVAAVGRSGVLRSVGLAICIAGLFALVPAAWAGLTERVSVSSAGVEANRGSNESVISAHGNFVAFTSFASNLVPGDANGVHDVFLHDRGTGATQRVSVSSAGGEPNIDSGDVAISADGRFVGFDSQASDLVSGDTNNLSDVFVHDRVTDATERVSLTAAGGEANGSSFGPKLSAAGRFVAFSSQASNVVPGDTNGVADTFVRDRLTGTNERVSVGSGGGEPNRPSGPVGISADGRFVAFLSPASNLVPGDTNGVTDLFLRDRQTGTTERVDLATTGAQLNDQVFNATLSANGRVVAFDTPASNVVPGDTNGTVDIFVRDLETATTERVNVGEAGEQANGISFFPSLSADGRFVAFDSLATNLVPGDTNATGDVFVRDRQAGTTESASVDSSGVQGNGQSFVASLNDDGRFVSFTSEASNLVAGDTNGVADVFVRDRGASPADLLRALIRSLAGLDLPRGTRQSLTAKLNAALAAVTDQDPETRPCAPLTGFLHEVRAQAGKMLSAAVAARLTSAAQEIRKAAGCSQG